MRDLFENKRKRDLLFHYTKACNAISILATKTLLFSRFNRLNDINESQRIIFCKSQEDNLLEKCDNALLSYEQISLTCDWSPNCDFTLRGFDLMTMWGHYADFGNGVCIVFNKKLIEEKCELDPECYHDYVEYQKDYDNAIIFDTNNPEEEIKEKIKDLFFCKSEQWAHEQEYRIVRKRRNASIVSLDVSNCIEAIIFSVLGADVNQQPYQTKDYWALNKVRGDIPLIGYYHRDLDGGRSLYQVSDRKTIWSNKQIVDLTDGSYVLDI